jgi:hypothetical protein
VEAKGGREGQEAGGHYREALHEARLEAVAGSDKEGGRG